VDGRKLALGAAALLALTRVARRDHGSRFVQDEVAQLYRYLKTSEADQGRVLARLNPGGFARWKCEDDARSRPSRVAGGFPPSPRASTPWLQGLSALGALDDVAARFRRQYPAQGVETPTFVFLSQPEVVRDQWLVHFTDRGSDVLREGFRRGVGDLTKLGLTTYLFDEKSRPGYNFAFLPGDLDDARSIASEDDDDSDELERKFKYGDQAIIFRASGVRAWHRGDEEHQVVFWGETAHDLVLVEATTRHRGREKWAVRDPRTGRTLVGGFFLDVVDWVKMNYDQYRSRLRGGRGVRPGTSINDTWSGSCPGPRP